MTKFSKSLYKSEVIVLLGWGASTLRRYLNVKYIDQLQEIGYKNTQKKLTPKQLNFLQEKIDLQLKNSHQSDVIT